ncbi:tfiid associated protein [Diaporthe amygdali]|uniref:tfiid associated protein n=1 Tax=Phomopsis amygdali TaxID=1214568 RepID=UPI0022FF1415|nr:tfiid associated protein [Diaporthe amygdali]KAJ0100744.1 tfiid associated protein [Diaporthe amygdali]
MQSAKFINVDLEDAGGFQCLRHRLYESLGPSFWKDHEVSKLIQWVRTVDVIHDWLEGAKEHYGRFIQQQNRETEKFHLPDSYIHEKFGEVYRRLGAMGPYLPRILRNGTHAGRLEEVTRRIADELWSGNFYWLDCFSELINAVLLDHDELVFELIKPITVFSSETAQPCCEVDRVSTANSKLIRTISSRVLSKAIPARIFITLRRWSGTPMSSDRISPSFRVSELVVSMVPSDTFPLVRPGENSQHPKPTHAVRKRVRYVDEDGDEKPEYLTQQQSTVVLNLRNT